MKTIVLGAGISGLAASVDRDWQVYERSAQPGGICASYYLSPGGKRAFRKSSDSDYRFEIGGGHWIFGASGRSYELMRKHASLKSYSRRASVYLSQYDLYLPYPMQYFIKLLPKNIYERIVREVKEDCCPLEKPKTMSEWLLMSFGPTLCDIFFFPFHELYTDGLFREVSGQDIYKTPFDRSSIGLDIPKEKMLGYNAQFLYPEDGLDSMIGSMSSKANINLGKEAVKIDTAKKEVFFNDGTATKYDRILSTIPLHTMLEMTGKKADGKFAYNATLVINIGARKGRKCPTDHWVYFPRTESGFYRVGFYSNVDRSFLPKNSEEERVSIYVEKAYKPGRNITRDDIDIYTKAVVSELTALGYVKEAEVVDATWIDVGYTWSYPDSGWREVAIRTLRDAGIDQMGRYGLWQFQGIAKSIEDALAYGRS